ncbi:MAG TPA: DUF6691 family protein [Chloroflexota bacterium]|nr:DUF6691 family protein [Chloroflexota bacterium]
MSTIAVETPAARALPEGGTQTRRLPLYASRMIARARAGRKANRLGFVLGLAFGLVLVLVRVHEYETIHNMLMLRDPYVFLLMGSAVATAAPLLWLLQRRRWQAPFGGELVAERQPVERRHIAGSIVFGTGWAITGACPGPALAMAASGNLLGGVVVAGLFVGLLLRDWVAQRQGLPESPSC